MKKLTLIVLAFTITVCTMLGVSADGIEGNIYQVDNVTVIFNVDSQFSVDQQETIAQLLVNPEYGVSQANLICNIFGHKNTQEGVTTITHKYYPDSPRCLQENFLITTCSRCNESTVERVSYMYITCCPED